MFNPISQFKTYEGYDGFSIRHLFLPSYFGTTGELEDAYSEMFDWLRENCSTKAYSILAMDNAAFSDVNEDPWIGYHLTIYEPETAMAFKLRWTP